MRKTDTPKDHLADKSYKRLFSHPQMVEDLLRDFVKPDWISQVDFTTLEKANASYVTDDYRDRSDDLVWKVQWRQETVLCIYLLLEFQSTVDPFMAVRIMAYLGLLYQDLIKTKQLTKDRQLPPVLPIVLYHGQADRWNAKRDIQDLIAPRPASLKRYRPRVRYFLIEAAKYSTAELAPLLLRNAVAAVFQLEHDRSPEQVLTVLSALSQWFTSPAQRLLNEELTQWIRNFIIVPQLPNHQLETFTNLQELTTMLATQLGDWTTHWKAQGRAEVLLRLLEEKFGPLATDLQNSLSQLEEHTVLEYVKRTFTANSVQEVFGPK